ncbi:hypothetical protein GCM10009080_46330 [Cupriavidus pauculus]
MIAFALPASVEDSVPLSAVWLNAGFTGIGPFMPGVGIIVWAATPRLCTLANNIARPMSWM